MFTHTTGMSHIKVHLCLQLRVDVFETDIKRWCMRSTYLLLFVTAYEQARNLVPIIQ